MSKSKKESVVESSTSEMLRHEAIVLQDDFDWNHPATDENVRTPEEVAQLNSGTKNQNNLTLTFETAKDAIANYLDNIYPPEKVSDARLETISKGIQQYRWSIIDSNGRGLALLLNDNAPSLSVERFTISTVASFSLTPESQQDGPMCCDHIYAKHHNLDHVCDVVRVLLQVACYSAKVYKENDVRYDYSWFSAAGREVKS